MLETKGHAKQSRVGRDPESLTSTYSANLRDATLGPCQLLKIGAVRKPEARVPAGIAAFSGLLSPDAGWCCSVCAWGMTAPRLDSTVAALAFNRVAHETFEKHDCAGNSGLA